MTNDQKSELANLISDEINLNEMWDESAVRLNNLVPAINEHVKKCVEFWQKISPADDVMVVEHEAVKYILKKPRPSTVDFKIILPFSFRLSVMEIQSTEIIEDYIGL